MPSLMSALPISSHMLISISSITFSLGSFWHTINHLIFSMFSKYFFLFSTLYLDCLSQCSVCFINSYMLACGTERACISSQDIFIDMNGRYS